MDYRGIHVDFYEDCLGHQIFGILEGILVEFGVYNTMYKDDAQLLIDDRLDTITRFEDDPKFRGAKLMRFRNADHTDVKLVYKKRILRIYPEFENWNEIDLISDATTYLRTHISFLIN